MRRNERVWPGSSRWARTRRRRPSTIGASRRRLARTRRARYFDRPSRVGLGNAHGRVEHFEPVALRKTPKQTAEQKAEQAERRDREYVQREARAAADQLKRDREAFFRTPAGQAQLAFERGDQVFQFSIDVTNQQAIIAATGGSTSSQSGLDPSAILNAVCREGWELVSGSFVFVEQGQQISSGQNVAIRGTTVGYYLFRRCEANRAAHVSVGSTPKGLPEQLGSGTVRELRNDRPSPGEAPLPSRSRLEPRQPE